jgi:hypothetical protein
MCRDCKKPIYTDGEDFWKWDPESKLFRLVDYTGQFYPSETHPGSTEQTLVVRVPDIRLAKETDIVWRTVNMILQGLQLAQWIPKH